MLLCALGWFLTGVLTTQARSTSDADTAGGNVATASRLANLSTFVRLRPDSGAPLSGFVITGEMKKQILIRAVGPGLRQFGLGDLLPDPVLTVFNGGGREIAHNAGWTSDANALDLPRLSTQAGAFQLSADSADSALVLHLAPGSYTVAISSLASSTGTALLEIYETDRVGTLASLATCAVVDAWYPMLSGGFVVRGTTPKTLLIRAVGPSLEAFGVDNTLSDPVLTISSTTGVIVRNDDWSSPADGDERANAIRTATAACGAFPLPADSWDATVLVTLQPGVYAAQVTGAGGSTGRVLLEVYGLP
jgi:hypothetical protein